MADNEKKQKKYKYHKRSFVIGKNADGAPERIYVRGKTKPEVNAKLDEAKRLHARGLMLGEMTVREWSERWLSVYKANATERQCEHYESKMRLDILPAIGSMRMKDVRASTLQELLNTYKGGRSGTVKKVMGAVKQLFREAAYEGIVERDPSARLELPEITAEVRRPLTVIERKAVLNVAETHPAGAYFLMMLYCGPRRGEDMAITRADIDLGNKRLTIGKSLYLRKNVGVVTGTKASKLRKAAEYDENIGVRTVPIPDIYLPVIAEKCEGKQSEDFIFTKKDGTMATAQTTKWWWESFSRQCHITAGAPLYRNAVVLEKSPFSPDVTPHYIRHTYATDLHAAGVDITTRKSFLGHASDDVTDIYTAVSDEAIDRAARLMNDYYNLQKWDSGV